MNRIKSLVFLLAAAILQTAPNLAAQEKVFDAKVPFEFFAGDRTMRAGEYRIRRHNAFLAIANREDFGSVLIVASGANSSSNGQAHLVFDRVNDLLFLRGLVSPDDSLELAVSRTEKKATMDQRRLSKANLPVAKTTVAISGGL